MPNGSRVSVAGVLTTTLGLLDSGRGSFVQDASGGIGLYFSAVPGELPAGTAVEVAGTLDERYGQRVIRLDLAQLAVLGRASLPEPIPLATGQVGEDQECVRAATEGTVTAAPDQLADGLGLWLDDGTGPLRVVVAAPAQGQIAVTRGMRLRVVGPVGQHVSGGSPGYRILATEPGAVVVLPALSSPSPSPTHPASPSPRPSPRPSSSDSVASPSPSPRPSPRPSSSDSVASPSPSPTPFHDLASALTHKGSDVDLDAIVTGPSGLFSWGGPSVVVDDGSAAAAVLLPDGTPAIAIGERLHLVGRVGQYEGAPRIVASLISGLGMADPIEPLTIGSIGPELEWRLVRVSGRISSVLHIGSRWRVELLVRGKLLAILGEPGAGITVSSQMRGRLALVTGIVRRSTSDHRQLQILPRSRADWILGAAVASAGPAATKRSSSGRPLASAATASVASSAGNPQVDDLPAFLHERVTVSGLIVDVAEGFATLDDGTGEVRLGGDEAAGAIASLEVDDAVEVSGMVERDGQGYWIQVDPEGLIVLPLFEPSAQPSGTGGGDSAGGSSSGIAGPGTSARPVNRILMGNDGQPNGAIWIGIGLATLGLSLTTLAALLTAIWVRRSRKRAQEA